MAESQERIDNGRRRLLKTAGAAAAGVVAAPWLAPLAKAAGTEPLSGLRDRIDHIIVIYQENRSFDHYFGTYRNPNGHPVANLLDTAGKIDRRFDGLQKDPAGVAYGVLPVPLDIPAFDSASLPNKPFHLAPYIPAGDNVPWDPAHHFFRMYEQVNSGKMDRFVGLAQTRHVADIEAQIRRMPKAGTAAHHEAVVKLLMAASKPSGAVLGHYRREDIPEYHALADEYALFDHFFQAMSGGSTGNALYLAAARSCQWSQAPAKLEGQLDPPILDKPYDRHGILINDLPPLLGPTEAWYGALKISPPPDEQRFANIGDLLSHAGQDWAWYAEGWDKVKPWALKTAFGPDDGSAVVQSDLIYNPHHNPFQYFPRWPGYVRGGHMRDVEDFRADTRDGKLPPVSFIKASAAHDEHPENSAPAIGMHWVMDRLKELAASSAWHRSLVLITYDEGGGFWDHVAPPRPDAYGCGTRIPALMVGPYVRRGYVDSHVADTTSVLRLIERRFGLPSLTARDAHAYDLLGALDFAQRPREAVFL